MKTMAYEQTQDNGSLLADQQQILFMKPEDLKNILDLHNKWRLGQKGGERACLGTSLQGAGLQGADLQDAYLQGAGLRGADLRGADLWRADLRDADLQDADLTDANLPPFQIPQEGNLVVWKKISSGLCKLLIPATARRTASLVGRKCRAEYAKVLKCESGPGRSQHDSNVLYLEGKIVGADRYNDDIRIECAGGIHFFLTKEEAQEW